MIIELILSPLLNIFRFLLSLIPIISYVPTSIADAITLIIKGIQFFPFDVWIACITSIVFWIELHLIVGIISIVLRFFHFDIFT